MSAHPSTADLRPFRIVVAATSLVYAYGGFYKVDLDLSRPGGIGTLVSNLVVGVDGLDAISSEKGDLASASNTWPDRSLFRFIDRAFSTRARSRPLGQPFSSLVCDDLGTEIADFIGVDEAGGRRIRWFTKPIDQFTTCDRLNLQEDDPRRKGVSPDGLRLQGLGLLLDPCAIVSVAQL